MSLRARLLSDGDACRLLPEQTQGPYHRPVHPERMDTTEGRLGVPLQLALRLVDADGRTPVAARSSTSGRPTPAVATPGTRQRR